MRTTFIFFSLSHIVTLSNKALFLNELQGLPKKKNKKKRNFPLLPKKMFAHSCHTQVSLSYSAKRSASWNHLVKYL